MPSAEAVLRKFGQVAVGLQSTAWSLNHQQEDGNHGRLIRQGELNEASRIIHEQ